LGGGEEKKKKRSWGEKMSSAKVLRASKTSSGKGKGGLVDWEERVCSLGGEEGGGQRPRRTIIREMATVLSGKEIQGVKLVS